MPARNILGETRNAGWPLMKQLKDAGGWWFSYFDEKRNEHCKDCGEGLVPQ